MKKDFSKMLTNSKFMTLSKKNQAKVIRALKRGRKYLSQSANGTEATAGLHYTLIHFGKMKNLVSLSTSVLDNPICQLRRLNAESICSHCFAASQMDCYKNMRPVFKKNLDILKETLLEEKDIPVILSKSGLGRGESFGDVCNHIQAANYMRIAAANPWLEWAVWTKNPEFYHRALELALADKPANLNIVLSSSMVNKVQDVPAKYSYFIDRVFTVYDEKGIDEQGITINCGALSCATCRKCYRKSDKVFLINEKLK